MWRELQGRPYNVKPIRESNELRNSPWDELETIEILFQWIKAGEISLGDAIKLFREQYYYSLNYCVTSGIVAKLKQAVELKIATN